MLAALSCSKDSSPKKKSGPKEQTSEAVIPAAGGSVELGGGVNLEVPGGAVEQDKSISLSFSQSAELINSSEYEGPVDGSSLKLPGTPLARMVFGPEGLQFDEPVTVEFPCTLPEDQTDVLYYNAATGEWVSQGPVSVSEGKGRFTIRHFSTYVAVRLSMAPMSKVENYVMSGLLAGKSADEIAAAFHEWAVNGDGRQLMRRPYKNPGNGLFYEPFYSFCSVAWCVYADGIESNPDASGLHEIGAKPENSSFCGVLQLASYFSGYDSSEQLRNFINGTTVEEKRSNQTKLFDTMVEIFYRLAKPDIQLSPSKQIQKKGDEATVTVDLSVFDQVQNGPLPYEGVKLEVSSSDPSVVSISKSEITTDGSGKATFKIKALKGEGSSTISVKFLQRGRLWSGGPDDYAEAVKTLEVSLGEAWELEFHVEASQTSKFKVTDYLWFTENQCNFPENSFSFSVNGNIQLNVAHETGKVKDLYRELMGEEPTAADLAGSGYGLNDDIEYDRVSGKMNVTMDPSKDVHYNLPDFSASSLSHSELGSLNGETLYSDIYSSVTCSYSVSYPYQNDIIDKEFSVAVTDSRKMVSLQFFDLSALTGQIISNPSLLNEISLLVTRVTTTGNEHTKHVSNITGTEESDEEINDENDSYLLPPMVMVFCLEEGTHTLKINDAQSITPEGGVYALMMEGSFPTHYAPETTWLQGWDDTVSYSGSITIRKAGKTNE